VAQVVHGADVSEDADATPQSRGLEAIARGLFGAVAPDHLDRIGEVVVICLERVIALATGWEPPSVGKLIAFHGSVTAAEMMVPLLIAR